MTRLWRRVDLWRRHAAARLVVIGIRPTAGTLVLSVPVVFLLVFYVYPLLTVLSVSLVGEGRLSLVPLGKLLRTAYYFRTFGFTIWQAAISTLVTMGVALPGAFLFARFDFPGRGILKSIATVPFVLPTVVVGMAFEALLAPTGILNTVLMELFRLDQPPLAIRHTFALILLAHVFYNYSVVLRIVSVYWANLNPRLEESAQVLGARRWTTMRRITLPLLRPALTSAGLLVFLYCFTSFGVILILGGPRFSTLEVEVYRQTVNYLDLPVAAALSLWQLSFTFAVIQLLARVQAGMKLELRPQSQKTTRRRPRSFWEWTLVWCVAGSIVALLLAPLLSLVARSLSIPTSRVPSVQFYASLLEDPRGSIFYVAPARAVWNSVSFAIATAALSVFLGIMAAAPLGTLSGVPVGVARSADILFTLPLGTSAVTLGLGYVIALDRPPLDLRTSPSLVLIAHTLIALPFVIRSVLPALRSIDPGIRESARLLGASPFQVWRHVDLPVAARALLAGAVFAFTISMGEFGATSLIARPERPTMPVAIYRFLGRPGVSNLGQAMAMASLLMLVCVVAFLAFDRLRVREVGTF
jgi:thiamine transport system permease protein